MLRKLEIPILAFFSLLLLFTCIIPIIYRYKITPPDREYLGYHEFYTDDYSIYLSNIYQGQYGRWTLLDKHTSEPHQGTIIHDEYLLWGKFTNIFKIGPVISYHLFRLSMGAILLIVIYFFLKTIFPSSPLSRMLSFFFILFSFGFPQISQSASGTSFGQYLEWLTEVDVFARFVALPHYLLGNIFFLLNVIAFFKISNDQKLSLSHYALLILSSVFAALIHPVAITSLCFYYAVYLFISGFLRFTLRQKILNKKEVISFLLTVLSAAPVLLYYKYLMTIPPWNHMAAWEGVTKYNVPLSQFIGAIGPNFLLAPIGLLFMIKDSLRGKFQISNFKFQIFLLSWILSFFLLIYFSYSFLHISEIRFMQVFIFIPFAILSGQAVIFIAKLITEKHFYLVLGTWSLVLFLISLPIYIRSFKTKLFYYETSSLLAFPPKEWMKGIYWLRDNTPKSAVILSAYQGGTAIPFNSGNTVYTGHFWATLNRERKEPLRDKFLKGQMTDNEAYNFFKNEKIDYLFFGYQEASYGVKPQIYKFLKPVFGTTMVIIYKFSP